MRFYVGDDNKEDEMKISVIQDKGKVHVMGQDSHGCNWVIFTLLTDGTFRRAASLRKNMGIQTDPHSRIKETKDF